MFLKLKLCITLLLMFLLDCNNSLYTRMYGIIQSQFIQLNRDFLLQGASQKSDILRIVIASE